MHKNEDTPKESSVNTKMVSGERLAKIIAKSGVCSRRDAEKLILEGKVKINGVVATTPAINVTDEKIEVNGKLISSPQSARLFLYYKPVGLVTTHRDEKGRPTVFENLPKHLPRVISVGRLDLNSEGLLLLTTSGELARKLELPSSNHKRVYRVRVFGKVNVGDLQQLKKGMRINGLQYGKADIEVEKLAANSWLRISIFEGKNREIRRMMQEFGLEVNRLIRISYGPYEIEDLQEGEVREVPCV